MSVKKFILNTDANNSGLEDVLSQEIDGQVRANAHCSKCLSKLELKYAKRMIHMELLAIISSIKTSIVSNKIK